ncbi:inositol, partial [Perkinsus olseni]
VQQRLGADQFTLAASRQLQGLLLVVFARVDLPYRALAVKTDAVATGAGNVKLYRRREKDTFRDMRGPVFLFGDLNFRVQCGNRAYCDRLLAMGRFDELLHKRCQLTRQLLHTDDSDDSRGSKESLAEIETVSRAPPWSEWKESPIFFPPTYKFDMGTNV